MAEYIDRERVIQEIKDMDNCGCITRSVNHVCENMRGIPTADVIERSKIDKAIEEIKDNTFEYIVFEGGYDDNEGVIRPKETTEVIRLDTLLQIFKSNIGE